MPQEIQNILLSALGVIITGLATWLSTYIVKLLNEKIKDKQFARWLSQIIEIITNAVKCTYQTYVEALKDENMFTKEAQEEALKRTLQSVKSQLSQESIKFIKDNFGDVEKWLIEKIESIIYSLKNLIYLY